jgi:hypothetical protein
VDYESAVAIAGFPFLADRTVTESGLNATNSNSISSCNLISSESSGNWFQFLGNDTCIAAHYSSIFLAVYAYRRQLLFFIVCRKGSNQERKIRMVC